MQPNLTEFVQARANKPRAKPEIKPAKPVLKAATPEPLKEPDAGLYKRATYYLEPQQIRALKIHAAYEDRTSSELLREALTQYMNSKPDYL